MEVRNHAVHIPPVYQPVSFHSSTIWKNSVWLSKLACGEKNYKMTSKEHTLA
jgi:hypothetical protein